VRTTTKSHQHPSGYTLNPSGSHPMNFNKAIIVGRLTRDPELRTTPSGQQVCNFSVATSRVWNNPNTHERQEKTEFHNVVAWGKIAEIAGRYLGKGALVLVEGRIETRSWDDTQSGTKKYRTEIIAESMQLGPRSANTGGGGASPRGASSPSEGRQQSPEEELPTIDLENDSQNTEINVKDIPF
jgi:single-strand DNA-binding protein